MRSHTEQRLLNVKQIASSFQTFTGGTVPQYIVAAPGRVNLIGEHIDHQGYPVLPVACSLSIYLAAGWSEPSNPDVSSILQITHCGDPQRYTQRVFKTPLAIALGAAHHWTDYIVCAFWAVIAYGFPEVGEKLRLKREASVSNERWLRAAKAQLEAKHVVLMVDGDLPTAAGLSSSSALLVAAIIAFSRCFGIFMTRHDVAAVATDAERYVGAAGGGMDQAAICFSRLNTAQLICFNPLSAEVVTLPTDAAVVVCNSGTLSQKAVDAAVCYNKRVFELVLAAFLLLQRTQHWNEDDERNFPHLTLRAVQERLGQSLTSMISVTLECISATPMLKDAVAEQLGASRLTKLLEERVGHGVWERNTTFEPQQRALHVYSEADRVEQFVTICRESRESDVASVTQLNKLGQILNASDASLISNFDCSTPELRNLTDTARSLGAYGARLVGAGWGGCILALVPEAEADNIVHRMSKLNPSGGMPLCQFGTSGDVVEKKDRRAFLVYPSAGAAVYDGTFCELQWE